MKIGPQQRPIFLFWCWLYMVLGACCLLAGLFLLLAPRFFGSTGDMGTRIIGLICVVFGIARMGNSVYALRRMRRPHP